MEEYLQPTLFFDFDHPEVVRFAEETGKGISDSVELIKAIYYAVRDGFEYNPYTFRPDPKTLSASYLLEKGESYCIPKAVLMGAVARYWGIPSRVGFADVRNHLASPQFLEYLQSDIFTMHGYVEVYVNDIWVKATPAFNKSLCDRMGVAPLEFDGIHDSIFHEFNEEGEKHMEYVAYHGEFADVPFDLIVQSIKKHYPHLSGKVASLENRSLEKDLA